MLLVATLLQAFKTRSTLKSEQEHKTAQLYDSYGKNSSIRNLCVKMANDCLQKTQFPRKAAYLPSFSVPRLIIQSYE